MEQGECFDRCPTRRRLILHLGWHKTGSTSIQHFLRTHRDTMLNQARLLYPSTGLQGHGHFALSKTLQDADLDLSLWSELVDELSERQAEWQTAVVSSEDLNLASEAQVESILAKLAHPAWEIQVVCYLRLVDQYLESLYAELLKGDRIERSWTSFKNGHLRSDFPSYRQKLDRWRCRLAPGAFRLRPYDPDQWQSNDLLSDFFGSIGVPAAVELASPVDRVWKNTTPDLETLVVLREVHHHIRQMGIALPPGFLKQRILNRLMQRRQLDPSPKPPFRLLSAAERLELRKRDQDWLKAQGVEFSHRAAQVDQPQGREFSEFSELDSRRATQLLIDMIGLLADELAQTRDRGSRSLPAVQPNRRAA